MLHSQSQTCQISENPATKPPPFQPKRKGHTAHTPTTPSLEGAPEKSRKGSRVAALNPGVAPLLHGSKWPHLGQTLAKSHQTWGDVASTRGATPLTPYITSHKRLGRSVASLQFWGLPRRVQVGETRSNPTSTAPKLKVHPPQACPRLATQVRGKKGAWVVVGSG